MPREMQVQCYKGRVITFAPGIEALLFVGLCVLFAMATTDLMAETT